METISDINKGGASSIEYKENEYDSNQHDESPPVDEINYPFSIDIISVQGPLFESLASADEIYCFQIHFVHNDQTYHSNKIDVIDIHKPIVFNFSVKTRDDIYSQLGIGKPRSCILVFVTCCPKTSTHNPGSRFGSIGDKGQTLVAQATIDYTVVQVFAGDFISVELTPCMVDYIYATGESPCSLFVRFNATQTIPLDSSKRQSLEDSMTAYHRTVTNVGRDVLQQLKAWWVKLRADYHHVSERQLKFVAEDECGRHRYVGNFISAISPEREINGPRYAARFVSLIPFKREVSLSGGRIHRWHSPFATLCRLQGDVEDHAVLLCSLLLGWGLNAYVAMGTLHTENDQSQLHAWVVTICETGRVTFWESLTAEIIDTNAPGMKDSHYREVWALFKHDEYLANIQVDCMSHSTSFDIHNPRYWRSFCIPSETSTILSHPGASLSLRDSGNLQVAMRVEQELEHKLMTWFKIERQESGLQTLFDKSLCFVLHPTLMSYELDRATGRTFGNIEFQSAIRRLVHRGECFQAYPTCFNHTDVDTIQRALLKTKAAREIIYARSQDLVDSNKPAPPPCPARFGIRVRVFPYPRGLCAVWVVLATCHQGKKDS